MLPYFWYILKVIICSGILFGYYWLFLRNKIFHQYNRFYLLVTVMLSLLLPLVKIDFWQQDYPQSQVIKALQVVSAGDEYVNNVIIKAPETNWGLQQVYPIFYWVISIIIFFIMLRTLFLIRTLLKKYPVQLIDKVSFVNTNDSNTPFSFLKYIFWNSSIDMGTTTGSRIFKHEVVHIREKHTHDKLLINTILIFFWCNPFFWLYRKELNMIHEFIADKKAVEDSDTAAFAAMILQAAYPKHRFQLTNQFFYSPIKRRLLMLTKNKNPKVSYIARVMVLPLAILVFAAFTFKAKKNTALYHGEKITVVIDAGHGGKDAGAGSMDGILEKDLTLAIAKKIKELNSNDAIEIVLSRDGDMIMSAQQRVDFAKSKDADLFISFHMDNGPKESANTKTGMSVIVARDEYSNSSESIILASAILNEFSNNFGLAVAPQPNQRQTGAWILKANTCPAVLIEAGFINNEKDLAYLQTNTAKETIAKNVLTAIEIFAQSMVLNKTVLNKISIADTIPAGIFVNVKHAGADYLKSEEYTSKALVIVDSKEMGNLGNNFVEKSREKYSSIVVYNPIEAKKEYGERGRYGVIKLTQKEASFITADSIFFDKDTKTIKLTGTNTTLKGDFSDALIYLDGKIISPEELTAIPPGKISSVNILKGEKLDGIIEAKGKKSVINISLKPDDLAEVVVTATARKKETPVAIALDKMNVFYIGVDNPVTIAVPGVPADKLLVTIDHGTITGNNGRYIVRVAQTGETTITVAIIKNEKKVLLSSQLFRIKRIPDPVDGKVAIDMDVKYNATPRFYFGNVKGSKAEVGFFKNQKEITVSEGYTFVSAQVYFSGAGFINVVSATLSNNSLNTLRPFLDKCENGTAVTFDKITLRAPDGKEKVIDGISYSLYSVEETNAMAQAKQNYFDKQLQYKKADASIEKAMTEKKLNDQELQNLKQKLVLDQQNKANLVYTEKVILYEKELQAQQNNMVFSKVEVSPQFTGGEDAWRKYLIKNLKAGTPVEEGWKAGKYTVIVQFIVQLDGSVSDVITTNYKRSKTAQHCIDIIKDAPKWEPAIQNGRKVNAYKKQPITFLIE